MNLTKIKQNTKEWATIFAIGIGGLVMGAVTLFALFWRLIVAFLIIAILWQIAF